MNQPLSLQVGRIYQDQGIYVGRPMKGLTGSPLANPFKISNSQSREDVIAKYRQWLWQQINSKGAAYDELIRLLKLAESHEKICLLCWCRTAGAAEPACHADVIIAALRWAHDRDEPA